MKRIAFIINPISGTKKKDKLPRLIQDNIDTSIFECCIHFTEYKGHGREMAQRFANEGYYAVVAVGGDGTVNEVAGGLIGTQTALFSVHVVPVLMLLSVLSSPKPANEACSLT